MGLFARIERIFHGKSQHCYFPATDQTGFGDSHGPNGHAPRTGNTPMGHSSRNYTQPFLLYVHHHQFSFHQSSVLLHLCIHL